MRCGFQGRIAHAERLYVKYGDVLQPLIIAVVEKQLVELKELLARLQYQPSKRIDMFLGCEDGEAKALPRLLKMMGNGLGKMEDGKEKKECLEVVKKLEEIVGRKDTEVE